MMFTETNYPEGFFLYRPVKKAAVQQIDYLIITYFLVHKNSLLIHLILSFS
jgi:hypothetical protein